MLIGPSSPAASQTLTDTALPTLATLSLAQAVEAAWQRAASAREADAQSLRARADRTVAASFAAGDPAFEVNHQSDRAHANAGRRETELGIVWPLWLPGQRDARLTAADAEIRLAELSAEAARLRVAGQVREAGWTLTAAQNEAQAARAQRQYFQGIADDVQRRVSAGDLARADALAAVSEVLAADAALADAEQRLQALKLQWRSLTGLEAVPGMEPLAAGSEPHEPLQAHPELRLAVQAVERAQRRLDAVNASRRDPPELSVKYRQENPGYGEPTQRGVGVGLRVPFGTSGRNAPLQAAAIGDLDVADATERRLRDRLENDLLAARGAVRSAAFQLDNARSRTRLLRERATLIDKAFKAGEMSLPELLRAANDAAQADAALARHQAGFGLAQAQLQQALGILP